MRHRLFTQTPAWASMVALVALLNVAGEIAAQQPAKAESNRRLIAREAKGILFLAHPTVNLTSATHALTTTFPDGAYALTYNFTWTNALDQPCYRYWHFHFNKAGTLTQIADGATNTVFAPFRLNQVVLDAVKERVRNQIRRGELDQNDPAAQLILAAPDMRPLTVGILQLAQLGQK